MRFYIILFLYSLLFVGCSKGKKTYYDTGELYEEYETNRLGEKDGMYKRFLTSGKLAETSEYVKDNRVGMRTLFFENGQIESTSYFINGKQEGEQKVYYHTGELLVLAQYKNSEIVGVFKKFYKNGNVSEEVTFKNNMENGPFTEYYENGKTKWKGQYLNGDNEFGIIEQYNEAGELIKKLQCDESKICKTIWEADTEENG